MRRANEIHTHILHQAHVFDADSFWNRIAEKAVVLSAVHATQNSRFAVECESVCWIVAHEPDAERCLVAVSGPSPFGNDTHQLIKMWIVGRPQAGASNDNGLFDFLRGVRANIFIGIGRDNFPALGVNDKALKIEASRLGTVVLDPGSNSNRRFASGLLGGNPCAVALYV